MRQWREIELSRWQSQGLGDRLKVRIYRSQNENGLEAPISPCVSGWRGKPTCKADGTVSHGRVVDLVNAGANILGGYRQELGQDLPVCPQSLDHSLSPVDERLRVIVVRPRWAQAGLFTAKWPLRPTQPIAPKG